MSVDIFNAAFSGNLKYVQSWIKDGCDVNSTDIKGDSILHKAAEGDHVDVLNVLIEAGANVNSKDKNLDCPLHEASGNGHTGIVKTLIHNGADVNVSNRFYNSPLHKASEGGHCDVANALLLAGAKVIDERKYHKTPLHHAVIGGHDDIVETLLKAGADTNTSDETESSPLHYAAKAGNTNIAEKLVKFGAKADHWDISHTTPLHFAAQGGYNDMVLSLTQTQADINVTNTNQETPLHCAAGSGHSEVVATLIRAGADVNVNSNGVTPLLKATEIGDLGIVKDLIQAGAIVNQTVPNTMSPLHCASVKGYTDILKLLIQCGADVNVRDKMTRKKSRLDQRTKRKRTVQLIPSPKRQRIEDVEPQGHENYDEILESIDINILLSNVLEKLEKVDCKKDFLAFLQCVVDDEFPLDNISFLLFLDTVRFYSSMNTKQMRYRQQTKAFWNAGQRLFHNKFLYFMSGPKNVGQLLEPTSELLSKNSGINFAVPDLKILSSFQENVFQVPKTLNTGCLSHILDKIQPCNGDSYMLCADAKKVTTGLDAKGGDVDFFGFEGVTLEKRISRFEEENRLIREIKINAAEIKKSPNGLQNIILILSTRVQECRDLKNRQEYGLQKFLNLGGTNWRDSKYVYAISSLQASLYQIRQFIKNALDEISNICRILSGLKSPLCEFESQVVVDATFKTNMLRLIDNQIIPGPTEPRFIKQRSDYWHKIRKSSRVTGSSIYNAIGLRGLKQQQAHYDEHIDGKIQLISTELEQRFRHGTDNEMHAVATVVGSILPIYFPNSCYVEEGCYLKYGLNVDQALLEVSPDGSIRDVHYSSVDGSIERIGKCLAAVEVKCPFPNGNEANVHHVLPDYYVAQCLAEMHVMETSRLIFVSYTANSSAVFDVTFDLELWMTIWNKISEIYDKDALQRPTKLTENVKSMKERMKEFTKSNVKFLGEYRSHRFHDQGLCVKSSTYPFLHGLEKERIVSSITQDEINYSMDTSSSLLNEGYNLLRKKATEIMVWVLTNKDRNSKLEIPCSVPVAFGLKDYRLSCKAMRQATGKVLAECRKRNIRVDSFAADGQWAQLMLRDGDGKPSTLLQLQKDVWRSVTKHSKQYLIAKISNLNKVQLEVIGDAKSNILLEKDVESGAVVVESTDRAFEAIRTTSRRDCWGKKGKKKKETVVEECEENDIEAQSQKLKDIEWLPNEILQKVTEGGNEELLKAIVLVEGTRTTILKENGETTKHYNPLLENNMEDVRSSIDDEMKETDMNNQEHGNETHRSPTIHHPLILSEESTSMLSNLLSRNSKISKYWNRDNPIDLFSDANTLVVLTHTEIDSVYEILRSEIHAHTPNQPGMRKSWPKLKKCEFLIDSFRQTSCFNAPTKSKRRRATVPKLCTMATKMLRGHQVPKDVIAIAYAQYVFYEERRNWYDSSPIKMVSNYMALRTRFHFGIHFQNIMNTLNL